MKGLRSKNEFLLSDITGLRKKFSSRLNNGQTTRSIKGAPRVGRGSDTNLSRPICDPIQKELEGPTKDRPAYWNAFARWISLHQHYIIDGDTYKRHTMPHEYINTSYIWSTSDYGWNTNRSSNDIHPASPGCRPGTYPLIEEAEEELNASKHRSRVMIIA